MRIKKYAKLAAIFLLAFTMMNIPGLLDSQMGLGVAQADPSSLYPLIVSVGETERVFFATHTSDLASGNWIELSGGTSVELPSVSVVYDGPDIDYERGTVRVRMESSFIPDITYPLSTHQFYKEGDSVSAKFWGSTDLEVSTVSFMLLRASALSDIKDVLDEGFSGAVTKLLESMLWIQFGVSIDSAGDATHSFTAPAPGDYLLVVSKIEDFWGGNPEFYIYSATPLEVVDYTLTVSTPSSVEKGTNLNIEANLIGASSGNYVYGYALIKESSYSGNMRLESTGSILSTQLYLNGELMAEGDLFTDFYTGNQDQSDLDIPLIGDKLGEAFDPDELSFADSTTGSTALSTSSLATGDYILLVGVWSDWSTRIVGVYQKTVTVTTPYVPPPPRPRPPPDEEVTPEEIEDLPPDEAADIIEDLDVSEAADIIEEMNVTAAADVIEQVSPEAAADIVEEMNVTSAAAVIEEMNVTVAADVIEEVSPEAAADIVEELIPETAVEILIETEVTIAADILETVNETNVGEILNTAIDTGETESFSNILLEMTENASAAALLSAEPESGATFIETMAESNLTETAMIVEAAIKLRARELDPEDAEELLERAADMLEEVTTQSLVDIFIMIAGLPATPSSVAHIIEVMDLNKVLTAINVWVSTDALQELADVFGFLTTETLKNIYIGMSSTDRTTLYSFLSVETIANLPSPATFEVSDLLIEPIQIELGDTVIISVNVINVGEMPGSYNVTLNVEEGLIISVKEITLQGGESQRVQFEIVPEAEGTYDVSLEGMIGTLSVIIPIIPPLPPILSVLTITPAEIVLGEEVTIGFDIENIDSQSITYNATMQIGELTLLVDVELGAYESKTVSRAITITPSTVGVFTVTVDGLTGEFTVTTPPLTPAEFIISDLTLDPSEIETGETVTISGYLNNIGETEGSYTLELKLDGNTFETESITVSGGSQASFTYYISSDEEGIHTITVDGLSESFTVTEGPPFWTSPGFVTGIIVVIFAAAAIIYLLWKGKLPRIYTPPTNTPEGP